jgi:beta-phosphoglucomutase family hydrolase
MLKLHFSTVIFDLDGVITDTAAVHSSAWKQMFDEFLKARAKRYNTPFIEFRHEEDYLPYVDGKPRYKGVESFLESRRIVLPYGNPHDSPQMESVCGLGNRKNQVFNQKILAGDIRIFETTVNFIHQLKKYNIRIGVASSSKNCKTVLDAAGLLDLFETRVDGVISAELGLKGKPEPDIFQTACDNLKVSYTQAVIVEDAVSGVQAGKKGGFGLVLGIARGGNSEELLTNGADISIGDIGEINIEQIEQWFSSQ